MKLTYLALALVLSGCAASAPSQRAAPIAANPNMTQSNETAVAAFVAACVNTAQNPNAVPAILASLGFVEKGTRNGRRQFESATATAAVSSNTNGGGLGQCSVTPKSGSFSASVGALNRQIRIAALPATKLANEEAWLIGSTGAVALISRSQGAMTRTQPNAFRN